MDVKGKTKNNVKARLDLAGHYRRPELELYVSANGNCKAKSKLHAYVGVEESFV